MELDIAQSKTINFKALGKGIITFNFRTALNNTYQLNHIRINFQQEHHNANERDFWIIINTNGCYYHSDDYPVQTISVDEKARIYTTEYLTHAFWISIFKEHNELQFGFGEPHQRTVLHTMTEINNNINKINIKSIKKVTISLMRQQGQNFECVKLPPNSEYSLKAYPVRFHENINQLVVNSNDNRGLLINDHLVDIKELDQECQELYSKIGGIKTLKEIGIELANYGLFEEAIQRSIRTPGCILHKMLVKKKKLIYDQTHSHDFEGMTYLRIAFSSSKNRNINSPGDAIILEIWPAGHYSPIHGHSDCYSIINVLSGSIKNQNFPFVSTCRYGQVAYDETVLTAGMVTWLGPHIFQTHKVTNTSNDRAAISLHAYKYGNVNDTHEGFFDMVDSQGFQRGHGLPPACDWVQYSKGKEQLFSNDGNNYRLGFIRAMQYESYLSNRFNSLQQLDTNNRGVSREIKNVHTQRLVFYANSKHNVVDAETDLKIVGIREDQFGFSRWIFIYSEYDKAYLIKSTEHDVYLASKGEVATDAQEEISNAPSAICLTHMKPHASEHNPDFPTQDDLLFWTIRRVQKGSLICNKYTKRYLSSIGGDEIDDLEDWMNSPRIVCYNKPHENRSYWIISPDIIIPNINN